MLGEFEIFKVNLLKMTLVVFKHFCQKTKIAKFRVYALCFAPQLRHAFGKNFSKRYFGYIFDGY